ncbi:unnamed protein product [Vicia faba]|uniref:Uncharacterized protein n=1 Tax=Vicia faba TaxID=3906 RepID=A0AAV1ANJ6_VICFA|nr:unnamed protein product [Vicia faba]
MDSSLVIEFWGNKEVEWTSCGAEGAFGGMLIMWKKNLLSLNFSFRGEGFVGVNALWNGNSYNFMNIYASCNSGRRRRMWNNLLDFKHMFGNDNWCLGGISMLFAKRMSVLVCLQGGIFMWFKDAGNAMSRLGRFLLTVNIINIWKISWQ